MIQNMLNVLIPAKLMEMCKRAKGDVMEGIKYLVAGGFIALLLGLVQSVFAGLMTGAVFIEAGVAIGMVFGWVLMLIPTIIVFYVILWLAHFLIAKLLKGKAAFPQLFFLVAVLVSALIILNAAATTVVTMIFLLMPVVGGLIFTIAELVIGIYGLYLLYCLIRTVYGFEMLHAILAVVLGLLAGGAVILLVLGLVLILLTLLITLGFLGTSGALGMRPAF